MVLTSNQYQIFRSRLIELHRSDCNNRNKLVQLKSKFCDEINSQRAFEGINTLSDLLIILEKRDVLGCEHITNLQYISNIIAPQDSLIQSLIDNSNGPGPVPNYNNFENNLRYGRVLSPVPSDRIERIHSLIRNDVGIKWRQLARALAIGEGYIDTLDKSYRGDIPNMVNEILQRHQENCGPNFELWRSKLQEALVTARRTDLSIRINDILSLIPAH